MKAYLAMKLLTKIETESGIRVDLSKDYRLGMVPVYKYKKGAREELGENVELVKVEIGYDKESEKC